jgi:hypothetical protein
MFVPDDESGLEKTRLIAPKLNGHDFVKRFEVHTEEGCYCPKNFSSLSIV